MIKKILFLVLTVCIFLFIPFCNSVEPPTGLTIELKLEDVSSTEAWIALTTNLKLPATIELKQNNQIISTINLDRSDSLLYTNSLLPNQTYTFLASHSGLSGISSNKLSVTTMDTTSHDFTWQTWTFGEHSSSVLYDVAIINENNIWAVGEIYMNDSLGQPDPNAYNAAYWNGISWQLKRIKVDFRGNLITPILEGIFTFSPTDIWFVGSLPIHGDGENWIMYDLRSTIDPNLSLSKAWGSNSNNIYFVGRNGSIAHYNGTNWQRIESGTNLNIYDIWGEYDSENSNYEIIAVAADRSVSSEKKILKINSTNTVIPLVTGGIPSSIVDVWFVANRKYYVCGAGFFLKNNVETNQVWEELNVSSVYLESIDGGGLNDVVICGSFGELMHFNGTSWMGYNELPVGSLLLSIKVKDDLIVTVGIENPNALIAIGSR